MKVDIYIQNGPDAVYAPVITGSITWEIKRSGSPGKLTFSVLSDDILKVEEGNAVRMDVDGKPVFFGFLFERSWDRDKIVKVVAYDQLRYLKNKDTYSYDKKTVGEVVQMIAQDYNLQVGILEDTGFRLSRVQKDKTLFDIILDAIDLTKIYAKQLYILYDDVGKLTLRNCENMLLTILIDQDTAENYDYKSSIDNNTYNQIKLYRDNDETKKRDVYMVKSSENINKWGILQYDEVIDKGVSGQAIAEAYLGIYNKPSRSLSIKNAIGDVSVRAGCYIPVILDIHGTKINNKLLVEEVKHKFDQGVHTMDLTLKGADIFG